MKSIWQSIEYSADTLNCMSALIQCRGSPLSRDSPLSVLILRCTVLIMERRDALGSGVIRRGWTKGVCRGCDCGVKGSPSGTRIWSRILAQWRFLGIMLVSIDTDRVSIRNWRGGAALARRPMNDTPSPTLTTPPFIPPVVSCNPFTSSSASSIISILQLQLLVSLRAKDRWDAIALGSHPHHNINWLPVSASHTCQSSRHIHI